MIPRFNYSPCNIKVRRHLWFSIGILLLPLTLAPALSACAQDAAALLARYDALQNQFSDNPVKKPMVLESSLSDNNIKGDIYAVVTHAFSTMRPSLQGLKPWCEILILHLDIKKCVAHDLPTEKRLAIDVVRKFDQPLSDAFRLNFSYRVAESSDNYLQLLLNADSGPLGTKNHRIGFEAVPLNATTSFVHMSYAYTQGIAAKVAFEVYLATLGRDKVGFTILNRQPDGKPIYIKTVRGVIERNAMRYYLAIEAYLSALHLPEAQQPDKRLHEWYNAIERYPIQLRELEREDYLSMKRKELWRMLE